MFDFSFWELAIVLMVALVVVGPDKLPVLAAKLGRWVGKVKQMLTAVRSDIEQELKSVELKEMLEQQQNEISQLRNILKDAQQSTHNEIRDIAGEQSAMSKAVDTAVTQVQAPQPNEASISSAESSAESTNSIHSSPTEEKS